MAGTHGSGDYMDQLRKRIGDGNFAQKERERRRRKVLMDQMRALKNQQVCTMDCTCMYVCAVRIYTYLHCIYVCTYIRMFLYNINMILKNTDVNV